MAHILMLDDSDSYDGDTRAYRPLGRAEGALINLAEALAARGHRVTAATPGIAARRIGQVDWGPLERCHGVRADLVIASRHPALFNRITAGAGTAKVLWLHNPGGYLGKMHHLMAVLRHRPLLVCLGEYHRRTIPPGLAWRGTRIIGHGVDAAFLEAPAHKALSAAPRPRAAFIANSECGLDWLLETWRSRIHPNLPGAELHIFAGAAVHAGRNAAQIAPPLAQTKETVCHGVVLRKALPQDALVEALSQMRILLYRGHRGEAFCLAAAQAQAMGLPVVTAGIGALEERVTEGENGLLRSEKAGFAEAAIRVLTDDPLWHRLHQGCVARRAELGWDRAAASFEALLPVRALTA